MEPDWSDLKVILALARARSVVGAAKIMGVDQSTVSRRLTSLEDAVGAALVIRGGRELTLTQEGRMLHAAAERMEKIVTETSQALRAAKEDVAGTVRLTCAPGFLLHVMQAVKAAQEKYPALTIEVNGDFRTVDLAKGEADVALRAFRPTEPDLVVRKLFELGWGVYASEGYQQARGLPACVDELPSHALILHWVSMHTVASFRWMDEHKGTATDVVRVDNLEVAAQLISSGAGIGVLPRFVADQQVQKLVRVFDESIAVTAAYCVYHESARNTARVRAAVDALTSYFELHAAAFRGDDFSP